MSSNTVGEPPWKRTSRDGVGVVRAAQPLWVSWALALVGDRARNKRAQSAKNRRRGQSDAVAPYSARPRVGLQLTLPVVEPPNAALAVLVKDLMRRTVGPISRRPALPLAPGVSRRMVETGPTQPAGTQVWGSPYRNAWLT